MLAVPVVVFLIYIYSKEEEELHKIHKHIPSARYFITLSVFSHKTYFNKLIVQVSTYLKMILNLFYCIY